MPGDSKPLVSDGVSYPSLEENTTRVVTAVLAFLLSLFCLPLLVMYLVFSLGLGRIGFQVKLITYFYKADF